MGLKAGRQLSAAPARHWSPYSEMQVRKKGITRAAAVANTLALLHRITHMHQSTAFFKVAVIRLGAIAVQQYNHVGTPVIPAVKSAAAE